MKKDFNKVLGDYNHALQTLDDYDHGCLSKEQEGTIKNEQNRILQQQLYEGKISWLEFMLQSEYCDDYCLYCEKNGIHANEQTAQQFWDWMQEQEKQAHIESES